jgi:GTP pyrophosphokinase
MPISGLFSGLSYSFAKCCHPVPGDKITGIITTGKGVTIHTQDCPVLERFADEPERWLDIDWNRQLLEDKTLPVRIKVVLMDKPTSMPTLMTILAQQNAPVSNLSTLRRSSGWVDIILDINIRNSDHLDTVLQALRSAEEIATVSRTKAG